MDAKSFTSRLNAALAVIRGKWKLSIICAIDAGVNRFGALHRAIPGISEKMLMESLRELCSANILERHDLGEVPPKVEYSLTANGGLLLRSLVPLAEWTDANLDTSRERPSNEVRRALA